MKTARDLLVEAKRRTILLAIWVLCLAYAMSLTSNSVWVNIPVALFLLALARCISGELVIRWRSTRPFSSSPRAPALSRKRSRSSQAPPTRTFSSTRPIMEFWRRGIEAPEVEAAINDLTKAVVNEWVMNLWFSSLSSDQEFPEELQAMINGVLAEVAQRAKRVNLITLLTQDIVDLVGNHLELFRRTQARVGADVLGILSTEERDENLRQALAASGELHPALLSPESESRVLQKLMGGVISAVLKPCDGNSKVLRSLARELLACAVMRPVLSMASPAFINLQIEKAAMVSQSVQARKSDGAGSKHFSSGDSPMLTDPAQTGLEMVGVGSSKVHHSGSESRGGHNDSSGKGDMKSPGSAHADKVDNQFSLQKENWAQVLEVVNQRRAQALAPEHLDNLWTKGRNYKKRELNKAALKPRETNVSKEQTICHPLSVDPPVPQAKPKRSDGKTTELVELRAEPSSVLSPRIDSDRKESASSRFSGSEKQVQRIRKSHSSGGLLDGWQDTDHYQEGIPSLLRAGNEYGIKTGGRKASLLDSTPQVDAPLSHPSWANQLQVDVVGAHFEKSNSKTFAVYSIFVTDGPDGNNRTWEVRRRYRNFEQLHRSLKDKPYYRLSLPAKRFLSSNLDNHFIRQRCALLDKYLKDLLSIPSVAELHEVWDFLSANSQKYGFGGESPSMFKTLTSNVDDAVDDMFRQFRNMSESNQEKLSGSAVEARLLLTHSSAMSSSGTNQAQVLNLPSSQPVASIRPVPFPAEKRIASQQILWEEDHFNPSHLEDPQSVPPLPEYDGQARGIFGASPLGSDPGDLRGMYDGNKLFDRAERSLSEGHSPVGSLAGSDMAEDDNLAVPPDWGPPKVSVPLLNLVDEIFELEGRGWIRRQVFWMAKQILTLGMGDAIDDFLFGKIQWLREEKVVAGGIRWVHGILWPDGIFMTKHPSREPGISDHGDTFEQRMELARRAGVVREIILDRAPHGLS